MIKPQPLTWLNHPIVDSEGRAFKAFADWLAKSVEAAIAPVITRQSSPQKSVPSGQIASGAVVQGRAENISTTLVNIDTSGKLNSLANVVDASTDHLTDGVGSPIQGGKRGFSALDADSRLKGTFRSNPVNVSSVPTGATSLSNNGVSTAVSISAITQQFGDGPVSYLPTSFDPGVFGTFYAWYIDPTFQGGSLTPQFSSSPVDQTSANGIVPIGKIISVGGSVKTGGGNTGGTTPGGTGGRGFNQG